MLQQTRASVVIPYFERWMRKYPDVFSLAAANLEEVIKDWEGLGYYSRVRNLYLGAKFIVEKHGGMMPSSKEELAKIKGLGPYTIGAILAFGFQRNEACVDGNVMRVLSRYHGIEEDITKPVVVKKIWKLAEKEVLNSTYHISEALIELGATLCQKKPSCHDCPLKGGCIAHQLGKEEEIPFKGKKKLYTDLIRGVLILECNGEFLVKKGEKGKIMADLYEFPYYEFEQKPNVSQMKKRIEKEFCEGQFIKAYSKKNQFFTRFRLELYPFHFSFPQKKQIPGFEWLTVKELLKKPFSSGHRKICSLFCT